MVIFYHNTMSNTTFYAYFKQKLTTILDYCLVDKLLTVLYNFGNITNYLVNKATQTHGSL